MAYTGNQGFGGLDARRAASDGAIRDMGNMSLRFSPALASRTKRRKIGGGWSDFGGAYYGERDFVVRGGKLYDGDDEVCSVSAGEKSMAVLESKLLVMPDKIVYDAVLKTAKDYGVSISNVGNDKEIYLTQRYTQSGAIITVTADMLLFKAGDFPDFGFVNKDKVTVSVKRDGKTVELTSVVPDEIGNIMVSDIYYRYMQFAQGTFSALGVSTDLKEVEAVAEYGYIPDMDMLFSSDNRMWGAKGREIYASSLGNPEDWTDYDVLSTSSWAATTKVGETVTAGCDFGGMPVFFTETSAYKIYGDTPKDFQYARQDMIGVTEGDHKSVAVGAGCIFYATRRGIYAWTGGIPQLISSPLGDGRITETVGGSDGAIYYLSCMQDGQHNLYAYDPLTFMWVREDDTKALDIRQRGRDLCMVTDGGEVWLIGDVYGTEGTAEDGIRYSMETADYNDGAVTQKSAKNILIQHELVGGEADVCVSYDGEPWNHVYTLYDTDGKKITSVIPLREKRYRTMRIRIEGDGEIVIYYMMRDVAPRTERPGGEKNVYL